jgi:cytochrome c oxidase subunit 2
MHWLMLFLFLGWGAFFIVSLYKFSSSRNKKASYTGVESHISSLLEGAIAIIEIIALFGFSYPVWSYRVNAVPDSRDAVNIRVIAQQFAWNIHYPGADGVFGKTDIKLVDEAEQNFIGIDRSDEFAKDDIILQNQMHIPVNKKIRVDLSSKDVIHNFKLPELRVSQDAIPGMTIPVHFTATMTSNQFLKTMVGTSREGKGLEIACAQLCGITHYRMRGYLTVDTEEEYNDWLASEAEYLDFGDDDDEWGDDEDW